MGSQAQLTASQEDVALLRQQMEHLELLLAESEHREQELGSSLRELHEREQRSAALPRVFFGKNVLKRRLHLMAHVCFICFACYHMFFV